MIKHEQIFDSNTGEIVELRVVRGIYKAHYFPLTGKAEVIREAPKNFISYTFLPVGNVGHSEQIEKNLPLSKSIDYLNKMIKDLKEVVKSEIGFF